MWINNIEPVIIEDDSPSYQSRTVKNAVWSDITLAMASNLMSQGELETANAAGDKYIPFQLPDNCVMLEDPGYVAHSVAGIIDAIRSHPRFAQLNAKGIRLNIAGNRLSVLSRYGIGQADIDAFVYSVIKGMLDGGVVIEEIRSGGQSGVDEAGIHAAQLCSKNCSILCPKGYRFSLADGRERRGLDEFADRFKEHIDKETVYREIYGYASSLLDGERDFIAKMANLAAVVHHLMGFWWTGFYLVKGEELVLGPFQGPVACLRIAYGKGVCGTAWKEGRTVIVPDVEQFPGHIACSSESRSEIVVPMRGKDGSVVGVLDIDSRELGRFDEADARWLERLVCLI